jgi:hypothetical protein
MTFNDVQEALKNLADHGHHFHLPTKEELFHGPFNKIFKCEIARVDRQQNGGRNFG